MKRINKSFFWIMVLVSGLLSCAKDQRLMYNEAPTVYFYKVGQTNSDSVDFTFGTAPDAITTDTINLSLNITGVAVNKDREINIVPMEGATAKAGYHYRLGKTVMPANAYTSQVPVYLYRRPGLKDSTVSVTLEIRESADFKPGFPDNPSINGKLDRLHYRINITDKLIKPGNWETSWSQYFGSYSLVKFRFLIDVTGRTNWTSAAYPQDIRFMIQAAKLALIEYQQQHGPLIDEFGQEVFFP